MKESSVVDAVPVVADDGSCASSMGSLVGILDQDLIDLIVRETTNNLKYEQGSNPQFG